ncbi:MAG: ABC transporter substrate-binding protein [Acidimicrobiales bacterium]
MAVVVAVLGSLTVWIATAPSSSSSSPVQASTSAGRTAVPVDQASTSSRGVTATAINVVFPVVSLNSLAGQEGFAADVEFGQQTQAIDLFVNQINRDGGIDGRRINPIIESYDPASESDMRSLCKTWTEGSPAAFAVVDGIGAWTGDNQLCVAQEGHTPFLGEWTTVTSWTDQGSPYLWWTGPDQTEILQALVDWGLRAHLLGGSRKVGVIAGDRASDQAALDEVLLPALRRAGVTPVVATIASDPSETATTDSEAPLVVQRFRSDGVDSVIPLIPFNVFFPILAAQSAQGYYPRLLLSDYESSIEVALGLMPIPYARALDGQEGVTTETLGGIDDDRPQSQGGYDPGLRSCWTLWHQAYPQVPPGTLSYYIEEQGPIADWCQAIRLFAAAARAAGPDLDRRTFVTALSTITDFPGTVTPVLGYGPDKHYGPTDYQVVRLHINEPVSTQCKLPKNRIPQGTCWVTVEPFTPLPSPGSS